VIAFDEQIATDPPVSEAQRKAMWAAASGHSTLGIPEKVGKEFVGADSAIHSAGIALRAPDGKLLFVKRGPDGDQPGTWCFPGGHREQGETSDETARREVEEETGYAHKGEMAPADLHRGFATYLANVPGAFAKRPDPEHVGFVWAHPDNAPQPLHPGVRSTLAIAHASDAEWKETDHPRQDEGKFGTGPAKSHQKANPASPYGGMGSINEVEKAVNKKLKANGYQYASQNGYTTTYKAQGKPDVRIDWSGESWNVGSEHSGEQLAQLRDFAMAGKAASDKAIDRASVRSYDADGRLHVRQTHISKANVCPYLGDEIPDNKALGLDPKKMYRLWRHPDELAKAVGTFNNLPLLSKHVRVDVVDHHPELVIGSTGTDAQFDAPYLDNSLVVWVKNSLDAIEAEEQKELSSAYRYRADMTPGVTPDGQAYDGIMRDIVGNHVAVVRQGRAGSDVVIGDEAPNASRWDFSPFVRKFDFSAFS
jgi:8-oxo-dGTP pyrophosphatase MutT (NUDIX family)